MTPRLIVGIPVRYGEKPRHVALPKRKFEFISHQSAGVACLHPQIYGTELKWKPEALKAAEILHDRWFGTDTGAWGVPLDDVLKYRDHIAVLFKATCNNCYTELLEAWYPIDVICVKNLTSESVPDDFDDWIDWEKSPDKAFGCVGRWHLVILGENSD